MRVAFVTCAEMPARAADDAAAAALLGADYPVWDDPRVDWTAYDRVLPRMTWDYSARLDAFLAWAWHVGPERLRNPPELIAWNADKTYLRELPVPIVPTTFAAPGAAPQLAAHELVVKPSVSAGARNTGRFLPAHHDQARALIARIQATGKTALIQPYQASVDSAGETALIFLGGVFSHAMRKRAVLDTQGIAPVTDDAMEVAVAMLADDLMSPAAASPAELAIATALVRHIAERFGLTPPYARVDLVADTDGDPVVMELELIEPNLYLADAPGAAERFAAAVRAS